MALRSDSNLPVFQQVADLIRHGISSGIYAPGDAIPSVRAQSLKLKVNPNTIQRAYEELERDGIIESRRGVGMFVAAAGEAPARASATESIRDAFEQGVRTSIAAGLTRAATDAAYSRAWQSQRSGAKS